MTRFQEAVNRVAGTDGSNNRKNISYTLEIVPGREMPELSIIDYLIWAVQRNLTSKEGRYFDALVHKYESVINLFE